MVSINLCKIFRSDNSISVSNSIELEDWSETSSDYEIVMDDKDDNYSIDLSKISDSSLEESIISSSDKDNRLLRKSSEKKVLVDDID